MNFKTTFKLERPASAWALSPGREPQLVHVETLVAGHDEVPVKEVGVGLYTTGKTEIRGRLSTTINTRVDVPEDFTLIVDGGHVVEHCHFVEHNENGGRFVAANLYHLPGSEPSKEMSEIDYWRMRVEEGLGAKLVMPLVDIGDYVGAYKAGVKDTGATRRTLNRIVEAWDRLDKASLYKALGRGAKSEAMGVPEDLLRQTPYLANKKFDGNVFDTSRFELEYQSSFIGSDGKIYVQHAVLRPKSIIEMDTMKESRRIEKLGEVKDIAALARERDELQREVNELRERLQFDPGGSDKVDELEQALQFVKHDHELDHNQLISIREDFERWLKVLPKEKLG